MAKARSPSYPSISLREAVEKIQRVYNQDYQNAIPRAIVAQHMGYQGINGKSLGILAAIAKYGLLEGRGNESRVSDLGVRIIAHPPGSTDRLLALLEAAGRPELFAELDARFAGGKGSDQGIRAYLLTQKFIPSGADLAIRAYRETKRFLEEEGIVDPIDISKRKTDITPVPEFIAPRENTKTLAVAAPLAVDRGDSPYRVGLTNDRLEVSATLFDVEDVDKLIKALEATKALLPGKEASPKRRSLEEEEDDEEEEKGFASVEPLKQ
jgi:hypothetical protein